LKVLCQSSEGKKAKEKSREREASSGAVGKMVPVAKVGITVTLLLLAALVVLALLVALVAGHRHKTLRIVSNASAVGTTHFLNLTIGHLDHAHVFIRITIRELRIASRGTSALLSLAGVATEAKAGGDQDSKGNDDGFGNHV